MNTRFGLEPFEDTCDERTHQTIIAHLAQASPAGQLCFVQRSNNDGNARVLRWLADRPETDRAAILAMYWNLGADSLPPGRVRLITNAKLAPGYQAPSSPKKQ